VRTEEQVRAALEYYRALTDAAHDYWDGYQGSLWERERRYGLYQEYMAKRDALAWMHGITDGSHPDSMYPVHTIFPPHLAAG